MTAVIETVGLTKRYGRKPALESCTLSIPAGKVVGLVGPNGAGMNRPGIPGGSIPWKRGWSHGQEAGVIEEVSA